MLNVIAGLLAIAYGETILMFDSAYKEGSILAILGAANVIVGVVTICK